MVTRCTLWGMVGAWRRWISKSRDRGRSDGSVDRDACDAQLFQTMWLFLNMHELTFSSLPPMGKECLQGFGHVMVSFFARQSALLSGQTRLPAARRRIEFPGPIQNLRCLLSADSKGLSAHKSNDRHA
jgi:hypothetical protein